MTWVTVKEFDLGVKVKKNTSNEVQVVAVFDEGKRVTKEVAPIQEEEVKWEASGYARAKEKYTE